MQPLAGVAEEMTVERSGWAHRLSQDNVLPPSSHTEVIHAPWPDPRVMNEEGQAS